MFVVAEKIDSETSHAGLGTPRCESASRRARASEAVDLMFANRILRAISMRALGIRSSYEGRMVDA